MSINYPHTFNSISNSHHLESTLHPAICKPLAGMCQSPSQHRGSVHRNMIEEWAERPGSHLSRKRTHFPLLNFLKQFEINEILFCDDNLNVRSLRPAMEVYRQLGKYIE